MLPDEAHHQQHRRQAAAFAVMDMLSHVEQGRPDVFERLELIMGPSLGALVLMYNDATEKRTRALEELAKSEGEVQF